MKSISLALVGTSLFQKFYHTDDIQSGKPSIHQEIAILPLVYLFGDFVVAITFFLLEKTNLKRFNNIYKNEAV